MKRIQITLLLPAFAALAILQSCGGGGEAESTGPKYNYERADSLPMGYLQELGIIKTNIEVTAKLYEDMNEAGYAFNESALMSSGKSFSGSSKQALGIGAIGTDMVFCASFGQSQSAMSRLEGLMKTANSLGISEAFDQELIEKMASEDSTVNKSVLLTKAYLNAKDQLFSEERAQLATFMVVGGWIEGLHVGCQVASSEINGQDVRLGLWSMCNAYKNVVHMTEVFKNNADMQSTKAKLDEIAPQVRKIVNNAKKYKPADVKALADAVATMRSSMY